MKSRFTGTILLILVAYSTFGQGELDEQQRAIVRNERSGHVLLNTNGWGAGFMYGKMIDIRHKTLWNAEFNFLKDSKELKVDNPYYPNRSRFVFGKDNAVLNLRLGYGKLNTWYLKQDKGGIEVRFFYHFGPTLAILKPVYYVVEDSSIVETIRFDPNIMTGWQTVAGAANVFKGMGELSVMPGIYARLGGSFEFGKKDAVINALEGGLSFDLYPQPLQIMANSNNNYLYVGLFVSYRFGQILDPKVKIIKDLEKKKAKQNASD